MSCSCRSAKPVPFPYVIHSSVLISLASRVILLRLSITVCPADWHYWGFVLVLLETQTSALSLVEHVWYEGRNM
jgi:hypothetical protein